MSLRIDPSELIAGALVVGGTGLGVRGDSIPEYGLHGASYLANDVDPGDAGKEFRGLVEAPPPLGAFFAWEDGTFTLVGAPDGAYTFTYRLFVDGADLGTATASMTVGTVAGVVGSAAGSGTVAHAGASLVSGSASGGGSATGTSDGGGVVSHTGYGSAIAVISGAAGGNLYQWVNIDWDLWLPFVLPCAPSCPESVAVHHVRQAAIEFLGFTKAWAADLAPITADGVATSFAMTLPAGAAGKKLEAVAVKPVGGKSDDATIPEPDDGEQRIRDEEMRLIAFSRDLATLTVWPLQAAGTVITPKMKLQPSQLSDGIPSFLFEQHAQAIANGALSKILAMPRSESVTWTDLTLAGVKQAEFNAAKATTARIVERGRSAVTRRPRTRWF